MKYFSQAGVGEFKCESHDLHEGDEIMITGPTTGIIQMKVKDLHVAGQSAKTAVKGDDFTLALEEKIRPSDKLYKLIPENQ